MNSLDLFLDEDREDARLIFDRGSAASIGRAEPVAADQFHAEAGLAGFAHAERTLADPDLKPWKIFQLA